MTSEHLTTSDLAPEDYRFIVEVPDADFSPRKNWYTVQKVIAETDKFFNSLESDLVKDKEDRIDMLSSYARYRFNVGTKAFDKYMGEKWMSKVIGERILQKIRVLETVQKLNEAKGNNKYLNFDLL